MPIDGDVLGKYSEWSDCSEDPMFRKRYDADKRRSAARRPLDSQYALVGTCSLGAICRNGCGGDRQFITLTASTRPVYVILLPVWPANIQPTVRSQRRSPSRRS